MIPSRPGVHPFRNRREAGQRLAELLPSWVPEEGVIVLGLPRGGMPVAAEVARALGAPLDVFLVRKLGVPRHEELAMGALAGYPSAGCEALFRHEEIIQSLGISEEVFNEAVRRTRDELRAREIAYRGHRPPPVLADRTCLLVDDGLATGSTMRGAVQALRTLQPRRIVVAVPVAAPDTVARLCGDGIEVTWVLAPAGFQAVGLWYQDFTQTTDEEVRQLLAHE